MCNHFCVDKVFHQPAFVSSAVGEFDKFWNSGQVIKIRFLNGTDEQRNKVRNFAAEWSNICNIIFKYVTEGESHVRISFDPNIGSWSYVGTDCLWVSADQPTMNFGWLDKAVVLHEFGHMLGLVHEHQNPEGGIQWNREQVIEDLSGYPNYWDENTIEWNIFRRYSEDKVQGTELDPMSIMMYPIPNSWTLNDFATQMNSNLSQVDIEFISSIYEFPPEEEDEYTPIEKIATEVFLSKSDLHRLNEPTLVRLGLLLGLDVDERYLKKYNLKVVWEHLMNI